MPIWKRNLYVCWFGAFITAIGISQIAPFLPMYIKQLGIHNQGTVEVYSGICFGITYLVSAIFSPLWAKVSDKYGRKPILLRACLGMGIVIFLTGFCTNVYELLALRIIQGAVTGYTSTCITLVATQSDKKHVGWALGVLSTATVSGSLIGPSLGGFLATTFGLRAVFFIIGSLLFIVFIGTLFFVKEKFEVITTTNLSTKEFWKLIPNPTIIIALFTTGFLLRLSLFSIEPMMTEYIVSIAGHINNIALISGITFSITGLGSMIASPVLGKWSDKIGTKKIILISVLTSAILYIPQAFVTNIYELAILRFILGFTTAGIIPGINSMIKKATTLDLTARTLGFNMTFQYIGMFLGSVIGGQIGDFIGIRYIFFITSTLLFINAIIIYSRIYKNPIEL
ncbi:multidrug efflux MFS transporter [Clostridium massiliamazoniense]|uniref:multidrug efflux MFS transporter n=1 Tax=Clostridium massiliamazoniense TaxID=1347366 RepID=UPI0006D76BD7|nr:multidrug efflux MFS transporter [Clostridium massiliamazoniense]